MSMGIIMSSLPVLEPVVEDMDIEVPSEEVRQCALCMCVYCIMCENFKCVFSVI